MQSELGIAMALLKLLITVFLHFWPFRFVMAFVPRGISPRRLGQAAGKSNEMLVWLPVEQWVVVAYRSLREHPSTWLRFLVEDVRFCQAPPADCELLRVQIYRN